MDQGFSQFSTQRGQRSDAGVTFINGGRMMLWCSLHAANSALLGKPSAPGRHDAAEVISTHLLEPALALIVITRPGPASHPHISAICSQLWNYKAGSHTRGSLVEIIPTSPFTIVIMITFSGFAGFTHHNTIMSETWRWSLDETNWPRSSSLEVPRETCSKPLSLSAFRISLWKCCDCINAACLLRSQVPSAHQALEFDVLAWLLTQSTFKYTILQYISN